MLETIRSVCNLCISFLCWFGSVVDLLGSSRWRCSSHLLSITFSFIQKACWFE